MAYLLFDGDGDALGQAFSIGGFEDAKREVEATPEMEATADFLETFVLDDEAAAQAVIDECSGREKFAKLVELIQTGAAPFTLESDNIVEDDGDGDEEGEDNDGDGDGAGQPVGGSEKPSDEEIEYGRKLLEGE